MSRKFIIIILLIVAGIYPLKSQINIDYANPKTYVVADISITGVKYLNHSALVQLSGLRKGGKIKIPGDDITRSVRKLWKQGLFSDVQVNYTKIQGDSIYLNIYLQERSRLSKVVFYGIGKSKRKDIEEKLGKDIKKGKQVTDNVLSKIKNTIRLHFVEKGFYNVKVSTITKPDTVYQNAVVLHINIKKGKKVKIQDIAFSGNTVFKERKLRRFLKDTKKKRWYRIFKLSKYVPTKYKDDKKKLVSKLNEKGYRDAKIISDSLIRNADNTLSLHLNISEGNKYYFRNIKWIGNTKFSSQLLDKALKIKKGDVYDQSLLDKRLTIDEDAVGNLYMDDGYLWFNVMPVEMQVVNDSVDLEMRIFEGPQARIDRVTILGNDRTNDHVVRREIRTLPGELFSKSKIIRTIRELAQLGYFDAEQIVPRPIPNRENGTVDLEYSLVEKSNDQIELSGGWGAGMIVGKIGLRFNNFSARNIFDKESWHPLPTGDGQQLSLSAQASGKRYQQYSISFVEPWLGGRKPNSFSVSLYHTIQNGYMPNYGYGRGYGGYGYGGYGYDGYGGYGYNDPYWEEKGADSQMQITGITVGLGRRLVWPDDYFFLQNSIGYQRYYLKDRYIGAVNMTNGTFNQLSFNTVFGRNSISQPLYPRFGSKFTLGLEFTLPFSWWNGKDYTENNKDLDKIKFKWLEFYKWTFNASWFTPIAGDKLVLNARAEYGLVGFYNSLIGPSPFEGYSVGGDGMGYQIYGRTPIGLRGYENGALTPQGANVYSRYTLELRYPITIKPSAVIYALTFLEAGNGWKDFSSMSPFNLYRSAGAGLRVYLPMLGLLGIDWAHGFDAGGKIRGQSFHFVLGQQF